MSTKKSLSAYIAETAFATIPENDSFKATFKGFKNCKNPATPGCLMMLHLISVTSGKSFTAPKYLADAKASDADLIDTTEEILCHTEGKNDAGYVTLVID